MAAAVIRDAGGRVLLARRTEGRDLAGLWEFPGGKIEAGETAQGALTRELREELGIEVESAQPLIRVPAHYADKSICLEVFEHVRYRGVPRGLESQALAWAPPEKLYQYPMPPADLPVVTAITRPDCYLITPELVGAESGFLANLRIALEQGSRLVQLRPGMVDAETFRKIGLAARQLCNAFDAQLLLNHDIELARELGVGVHLRSEQLLGLESRPLSKELKVFGSCHNRSELLHAEKLDLDAVVLGPVARSTSHPDQEGIGWQAFFELRAYCALPVYAIGGLQASDVESSRQYGAQGIAAISSLWPNSASPSA